MASKNVLLDNKERFQKKTSIPDSLINKAIDEKEQKQ